MLSQQILHVGLNRVLILILIRNESMTDPKVFRNESISVALIIFLRVRSFARSLEGRSTFVAWSRCRRKWSLHEADLTKQVLQ